MKSGTAEQMTWDFVLRALMIPLFPLFPGGASSGPPQPRCIQVIPVAYQIARLLGWIEAVN